MDRKLFMNSPRERTPWTWNEFQHVGTDFGDQEQVRQYDRRMGRFRDIEGEIQRALSAVELGPDQTLVEIGCGTGRLARAAANICRKVYAYDISEAMLRFAADEAEKAGLTEKIRFRRGGFLSCHEDDEPVDVVVTQIAMHHLPDFWKGIALKRIADMLTPGGMFYIYDVIFSFPISQWGESLVRQWLELLPPDTREKGLHHLAREYSTQDWIFEGLCRQAGFRLLSKQVAGPFFAGYTCQID
jgi:ubiquinone/menaquinone biosynthesis C-methylase UbiE